MEKEILASWWFTGGGIVVVDNGFMIKSYIRSLISEGGTEKGDEKFISQLGSPFPIEAAKEIFPNIDWDKYKK